MNDSARKIQLSTGGVVELRIDGFNPLAEGAAPDLMFFVQVANLIDEYERNADARRAAELSALGAT
jgi:hypothetical protein